MSEKEEKEQRSIAEVTLPIEWHVPDNLQSRYATNVVVQALKHEFVISFFEIIPPVLLDGSEENKTKLEQMKSIVAECVGRVIVSAEEIPAIIDALQNSLDAYLAAKPDRK